MSLNTTSRRQQDWFRNSLPSPRATGRHQATMLCGHAGSATRGFTMVEVLVVIAISLILATVAVPLTQNTLVAYRFGSAVAQVSGAIQTVRYQAVMRGYSFAITIDQTAAAYQISSKPPGATVFTNVGGPIPLGPSANITLSPATTTLQCNPNGTVQATAGALSFTMSNGVNTRTITVSGVGNVTLTP